MHACMDRRSFTRLALTGLGIAALPPSVTRAEPEAATPAAAPLSSWAPPSARTGTRPPDFTDKPYARLLEKARATLDARQADFALRDRVAIADFNQASRELRFHIVDLIGGQASSYLVAHGRGSDPGHSGWLRSFSNDPGSLATSEGAYRTGQIYDGVHGAAMRLIGLDPGNTNAEARAIVIHAADYVSENQIATWGKLGRSEGCFAVAPHMLAQVLGMLGPGRLLYADKV
jgi:hypothetical protein